MTLVVCAAYVNNVTRAELFAPLQDYVEHTLSISACDDASDDATDLYKVKKGMALLGLLPTRQPLPEPQEGVLAFAEQTPLPPREMATEWFVPPEPGA